MIGRITVRELATLMTAIMVAGRSGSAFAAQIGTMKITEEIDAMRTIGVSPIEALVIPRLLASTIMMPLLAFFAMIASLLGGGIFVWLVLNIPPLTYVQLLQEVVPITDLWIGLIKAPVFGFIIGPPCSRHAVHCIAGSGSARRMLCQSSPPGHVPAVCAVSSADRLK